MRGLDQIIAANNTAAIDLAAAAARRDRYERALKQIVEAVDSPLAEAVSRESMLAAIRESAATALGI